MTTTFTPPSPPSSQPAPPRRSGDNGRLWILVAVLAILAAAAAITAAFALLLVAGDDGSETTEVANAPADPVADPAVTTPGAEVFSDADDEALSNAAPVPTGLQPLTLYGMGAITFGMTVIEAESVLQTHIEFGAAVSEGCFSGTDPTDVNSPWFMVLSPTGDAHDGQIVRIDLRESGATRSGITFGSTKDEVLAAYGDRIVATVHPYDASPGSEYLTFVPADEADADYRMILETSGDRVVGIRAGILPAVEWIESCL